MDPGTCLAVVSLALELSKGLLGYYELWSNGDQDIVEIQRSLISLTSIFAQLEMTLRKPNLREDIVHGILVTMTNCEGRLQQLQRLLDKIRGEGSPADARAKLRSKIRQRALYVFHAKEIQKTRDLLAELRKDLDLEVQVLNLNTAVTNVEELQILLGDLNRAREEIEQTKTEVVRNKVLVMLSPCSVAAFHLLMLEKHEPGTGRWFLNGEMFTEWRDSEQAQYLWLTGDVGCGKTVLFYVIENLRLLTGTNSRKPETRLAYFYFTFDNIERQDLSACLRSLLAQLCVQDGWFIPRWRVCFRTGCQWPTLRPWSCTSGQEKKPALIAQETPTVTTTPHTYLILDGIDEIPYGPQRAAVLRFLRALSDQKHPHLHVLASSRPERDIGDQAFFASHWKLTEITKQNIQADLGVYIINQIADTPSLKRQPMAIKMDLEDKLVRNAGGMFRWTALQIQELKSRRILRPVDIQGILSTLPRGLDTTYERILKSVDPSLIEEATTALQWLATASRPLFVEELVEACMLVPRDDVVLEEDRRLTVHDIPEILPGLIVVDPPLQQRGGCFERLHHRISLAHFSVKEYLLSTRIRCGLAQIFAIKIGLAHRHVSLSCLAMISHHLGSRSSKSELWELAKENFALVPYAHAWWDCHAEHVPTDLQAEIVKTASAIFQQPEAPLVSVMLSEATLQRQKIPMSASMSRDWPQHYMWWHAIQTRSKLRILVLLHAGLRVDRKNMPEESFRLAIEEYRTNQLFDGEYAELSTDAVLESLDSPIRRSIVNSLINAGYMPSGHDLTLAAQFCPRKLVTLILEKLAHCSIPVILKAVRGALTLSNLDNANLLLDYLL
ncbi:hypothetical protein QBC34DRAFT_314070, partial [Podospora aff. communis PSN243]